MPESRSHGTGGSAALNHNGSGNKRGGGLWKRLGPGLVTGASDDDPSGIATYAQVGAAFGFGLLWTMLFCLPLMASIQEISARIGRTTGRGIAGNIRRNYPAWLLYSVVLLLLIANTINLGADIGAMGDCLHLLIGGPAEMYCVLFAMICIGLQVFASYSVVSKALKWLTLSLLSYAITTFVVDVPWKAALAGTFVPSFTFTKDYWASLVAVLGTTISPYLFFWQASQETEELKQPPKEAPLKEEPQQTRPELQRIRFDTYVGMTISNLIAYCIILATAATLHGSGTTEIHSAVQAAEALRPVAGRAALFLFALGIVGTGLLTVPVLAGSAAYAVGEVMKWPTGMDRKPRDAKGFYVVLIVATCLGLAINFPAVQHWTQLSAMRALFWSAVINGVIAAPIMAVMLLMSRNPKVMGPLVHISKGLNIMGWLATAAMAMAAMAMFVTWEAH